MEVLLGATLSKIGVKGQSVFLESRSIGRHTTSLITAPVIIRATGNNIIRTQVSLHKKEYDSAKQQSAALGISFAEFVRRAVREQLPVHGSEPWMKFAGFVESGDPRSSQSIDEIVYGGKD